MPQDSNEQAQLLQIYSSSTKKALLQNFWISHASSNPDMP
jgi:hypothetical protein